MSAGRHSSSQSVAVSVDLSSKITKLYLLANNIAYLIKVFRRQECLAGEAVQPLPVSLMVVQGKYGIDVLPFSQLGRN